MGAETPKLNRELLVGMEVEMLWNDGSWHRGEIRNVKWTSPPGTIVGFPKELGGDGSTTFVAYPDTRMVIRPWQPGVAKGIARSHHRPATKRAEGLKAVTAVCAVVTQASATCATTPEWRDGGITGAERVGAGGIGSSGETLAVVGTAVTLLVALLLLLPWVRSAPNATNPGHAPLRAKTRQWKWWTMEIPGLRAARWAMGAVAAVSSQLREPTELNFEPARTHAWAGAIGHSVMVLTALAATATVATRWIRRVRVASATEPIETMHTTNQRQAEANAQTELLRGHNRSPAVPAADGVARLTPHVRRG